MLTGHTGSVKSISSHPTNPGKISLCMPLYASTMHWILCNHKYISNLHSFISKLTDILVSGSRDGSFRLWDLRCYSYSNRRREVSIW